MVISRYASSSTRLGPWLSFGALRLEFEPCPPECGSCSASRPLRFSSLILATFSCLSWGIPRSEGAFGFKESEFVFQSPISWWIFDLTHVLENTETGNKPITGAKLDGQLWAMHY
ncbi:hypothetical protein VNO77_42181 [Canavalia gladiata]|uniref:Uncharacterized protein n=1 Tax=Canavalia gladiata TaxID=3824 RepID=A0AAN9K1V5_CANGL